MEILIAIIKSIVPGIIVGIILAFWNRGQKKRDDKNSEMDAERQHSEELRISLLVASAQLSYAVAMAIKRGSPNGEIEEGIKEYNKAMEKFRKFEREQLIKNTIMNGG